ncbi:MAG: CDP-alcohol phosphatidyltransferase family protein [Ferruginibacter sp.]|nr:CDP-alcohol phosphatidyltransferase family protein [Ferruginibacter sp.]
MKQFPNFFTLINLIFGCLAIVATLQNGITIQYNGDGTQLVDIPEKIWMASLFIGIAAAVDFLDGFVARLFNASSEMGKQLDSLADVVSFGVAPAMIIYQFLRLAFAKEESGIDVSIAWLTPAFILAAAAAYRLAKFNLDNRQQYGFRGMPTPAVGLLIASFPLIYWHAESELVIKVLLNKWVLYSLVIGLSWLMISDLPMMALKFKNSSLRGNLSKVILLILSLVSILLFQWLAIPVIFVSYIILSLVFKNDSR